MSTCDRCGEERMILFQLPTCGCDWGRKLRHPNDGRKIVYYCAFKDSNTGWGPYEKAEDWLSFRDETMARNAWQGTDGNHMFRIRARVCDEVDDCDEISPGLKKMDFYDFVIEPI